MVGEWVVGDVLGLHGLADGLGDGLASGHAVDDLLDVAVLQRNNGVNGLGRVDAVLGGHLMASVLDGGDSWGDGCGHSSWGVSESGVSVSGGGEVLRVGLGVSLTLDQMGWSSGAVGGGDVLADLLVLDVLVGDVDGVADGL